MNLFLFALCIKLVFVYVIFANLMVNRISYVLLENIYTLETLHYRVVGCKTLQVAMTFLKSQLISAGTRPIKSLIKMTNLGSFFLSIMILFRL